MDTNRVWLRWHNALSVAILLVSLALPAWSNVHFPSLSGENSKKLCYCGCDSKAGTPMCNNMCDLPQYQGRWWANSCGAKQEKARNMAPPASHVNSKKNNKVQSASL
jgi:hypothetical protein